MKKISKIILTLCLMLLPMININADELEEIDIEKYEVLNFKETLESEDMKIKNSDYKENDKQTTIYLFRGQGCAYCRKFLEFLNDISKEYGKYFKVVSFESWYDEENANLLEKISGFMGDTARGVPFIVIGDQKFPGYSSDYDEGIKAAIKEQYEAEKKYDVIEKYNEYVKEEHKKANRANNTIIIWNLFFIIVATVVIMVYINSKNKEILAAINTEKTTVEKSTKKATVRKLTKKTKKEE